MRILLIVLATLLGLAGPAWADWRSEFNAGNAVYGNGDLDTAIALYTNAIELKPNEALVYYNRIAYRGKKLYDQAISDSTKAIELTPAFAEAYVNRGGLYDGRELCDQATDFTKAIALKPKFAAVYSNRGTAYVHKKLYDRAIAD